ncbi:OmpA family protein [Aggregicoccus sp. 17bor-14]|uniref:OmpA family protein n=1 Tax=Myxococcaceae TaxID=31 RepID=UPI00129CE8CA|nr:MULTISPECIES: OmpA family protein [Myxococcaceae]MBF5042670.1 OmpA family protein [Simulacricoccus sp. 17bor-14]MRI88438.1 OmpA family protein [Aggregicoccus sp. 17bor-14]
MRRISLVAGLGLALLALTGCPPSYPKCDNDKQCSEKGEVCVQGQCQECATDANCKEGFACQDNKCSPKAQTCTSDSACGAGKICEAGTCAPAQCQDNGACGTGSCQNGRCVAKAEGTCSSNADCTDGQTCQAGKCAADTSASCDFSPVRFGFNEATLSGDAQSRLSDIANCLKGGSGKVTLAGHADERGTEEYNLQLSNRRAAAVKRYLVDLGVPAGRLETVGYGENRPVAQGQDEDSWAQNRRVEFVR